ncbi:MAG: efflux RND transporter periplasmic adaptor subunit [Rhodothermaceae bacterium]|nr:efflux RND transporter periplasmic adaptor subunit [Bacteroidota bacterium]MXW14610.1 efflux RND transporter periplasmic adaptor subunit [Rhodothermaceae bacterium]MDE2644648.1 efflux RND transporter periplasmic adaptor subunit [Bacteroidota bacterium]MXW33069.1 efflux RND transporter periplasmic adaptor subunit [Rhodothermaceae bacterium]MXX98015.1 efflux RND transporter periplasmic adaptor subunit [Rhodothermaceae bacterium]
MAKKKNRTRTILIIIGIAVILLVILGLVGRRLSGPNATRVEIVTVETRTVTQTVTASGRVQPEVEIIISPDVSGEIVQLPVVEGQQVQRGELLARIKSDFYEAQVEQAEAQLSQAKANLSQQEANLLLQEQTLDRQRQLYEAEVIPLDQYEQSDTQYKVAQANVDAARFNVESAQARLRESQEQLRKTALYAPMSGTVSQLDIELGERVTGNELQAGTTVMKVARLDQMELEVEVSENDVVNVALGDTASIEVDAYPNRIFKGVVTEIANSARLQGSTFQEQVTNFPVKVRILDPHNAEARAMGMADAGLAGETPATEDYPSFRPGMSGTVDIFTNTVQEVLSIPIQAVTVRDFNAIKRARSTAAEADTTAGDEEEVKPDITVGGEEDLQRMVFVVDETMNVTATIVETGISDDQFIEIKSGLEEGNRVVNGPYSAVSRELDDGDLVEERGAGRSL